MNSGHTRSIDKRRSVNRVLVFMFLFVVVSTGLTISSIYSIRARSIAGQRQFFSTTTKVLSREYNNWVQEQSMQVRFLMEDSEVKKYLLEILDKSGRFNEPSLTSHGIDFLRTRLKHRMLQADSLGYMITDQRGNVLENGFGKDLVSIVSGLDSNMEVQENLTNSQVLLQLRMLEIPSTSDPLDGVTSRFLPIILAGAPVRNDSGAAIGTLQLAYDPQEVLDKLKFETEQLPSLNLRLLDRNGMVIGSTGAAQPTTLRGIFEPGSSEQVILRDAEYARFFSTSSGPEQVELPVELFASGFYTSVMDENPDGRDIIRAGILNTEYGYILDLTATRKQALVNYYDTRNRLLLIFLLMDLLAVIAAVACIQLIRKSANFEEMLHNSKAQLQHILNTNKIGMILLDRGGIIRFWSDRAQEIFGIDKNSAVGQKIGSFFREKEFWVKLEPCISKFTMSNDRTSPERLNISAKKGGELLTLELSVSLFENKTEDLITILSRDISMRAGTERTLKRSMNLLKKAQVISNMGYWEYDVAEKKYHFSQEVLSILGREESDCESDDNLLIPKFHPDDKMRVEGAIRNWFKTERPMSLNHRIIRDDGSVCHVKHQGFIHRDEFDNNKIFIGTIQDLTEHFEREEQLQMLSDRLQLATRTGEIGIWQYDFESEELRWDDTMFKIYQVSPNEFHNNWMDWQKLILSDDYKVLHAEFERCLEEKGDLQAQFRIRHPDGSIHHITTQAKLEFNESGDAVSIIGVNIDVTEYFEAVRLREKFNEELEDRIEERTRELEKANRVAISIMRDANRSQSKAEEALEMLRYAQKEQQKLLTAVISSPVAVSILDTNREFEYANPMFFRLTGYQADDVYGRSFNLLQTGDLPDNYNERVWTKVAGGGSWSGDMLCKTKQGKDIWMHTVLAPILASDGKVTNYIAILEDTTKQREIQQRLESALLEASSASKAKGEFLANISHEIRTPMNAILGFTEILSQKVKEPGLQRYMDSLKSSGQVLLDLINNILELSRLESGKIDLSPEPVEIRKLFNRVTEMFTYKATDKGINLTGEVDESVPSYLTLDPNRISQVLMNLVGNAVKFTRKGSVQVILTATQEKNKANCVHLSFKIQDSGLGIDSKHLARIFQSFEQIRDPDSHKEVGTGLGLAITKRIVEAMGGNITVMSKKGAGSVFTVDLPMTPIPSEEERRDSHNIVARAENLVFEPAKILVADDAESNREILGELFSDYPFEIIFANDGEEAIQLARKEFPQVIFMDIKMPVMDGITATKKLRRYKNTKKIPVIALTGSTSDYEASKKQDIWNGQLLKPVRLTALIQCLQEFLPYEIMKQADSAPVDSKNWNTLDEMLDSDNLENYRKVADVLKSYGEEAEKLSESMSIDQIEEFAIKLRDFSVNHGLAELEKLTESLLAEIQMFEVSRIKSILNLIMNLKDYSFT